MMTKNVFSNVSPALTSGYHGTDRAKQNIKQWVIGFCALSLVTDDGEMHFDGIYVHGYSSKEEHKITVGWLGQLWTENVHDLALEDLLVVAQLNCRRLFVGKQYFWRIKTYFMNTQILNHKNKPK